MLYDLLRTDARATDVMAPRGRHGGPGIRLHRTRFLHPEDTAVRDGIPVTSVARTLLDLAEVLTPRQLERAFEQAERLRLLDVRAVERLCARSPGRRGRKPLASLLESQQALPADTRSELERRFLDLCRDAGLPLPALNVSLAGFEVDAYWPQARLVAELDSYSFHRSRRSFESDRARDAALQVAGCRVIRITHRRLDGEAAKVIQELRSLTSRDYA
jgi:hypothetical protein